MKYCYYFCLCLLILIAASAPTEADDCPGSAVYIKSAANGQYYAKAIPEENIGSKGVTKIYAVRKGQDQLLETYPWYASRIELQNTAWGISITRMTGSCGRGAMSKPRRDDIALGFYLAGKTLKEYSTLDLSGLEDNLKDATSYFGILKANYRWLHSDHYAFDVETGSGKTISFDIRTGMLLTQLNSHYQP